MSHDPREPQAFTVTTSCVDDDGEPCGPWKYAVDLGEQAEITGPRRTTAQWLGEIDKKLAGIERAFERMTAIARLPPDEDPSDGT